MLGSRWVAERADAPLSKEVRNALAKIVAVLPDDMRRHLLRLCPHCPISPLDRAGKVARGRCACHQLRQATLPTLHC
jgi:hypothetical protein